VVLAGLLADAPDRSVTRCLAGTHWAWEGVAFDELHPAAGAQSRKDNAMSCVLRVASGARSVLITSDIEAAQELALIAANAPLATDVLLVPHHGSRTSSTPEFVAATSARDVIFPVGYRNRFGHPRADIVERYAASGARLHRTDRDGAISFRLAPDVAPVPQAQRVERQRYWHGR